VRKLLLISPLGVSKKDFTEKKEEKHSFFVSIAKLIYEKKYTLTKFLNFPIVPANLIIHLYFSQRLDLKKEELTLICKYFHSVYKQPESSEPGFYFLFKQYRESAIYSLEDLYN